MSEKLTIRKFFKKELDSEDAFLFRMVYDGQSWAGNNKKGQAHRNTRVSILIPKEIAENSLGFMRDWNFYIIGFKIERD